MKLLKINEKYRAIIEWTIAIVLMAVSWRFSSLSYGSFSPLKAHEQSERTYFYGPSKIIKTIDLHEQKIYLCRYKDWFSADTVNKGIIKWYSGSGVSGTPIDYSKQVTFTWNAPANKQNKMTFKVFGYVNNPEITAILLLGEDGTKASRYDLDKDRMFIFYWIDNRPEYLKGVNNDGKIIYEEKVN